MERTLVLFKPDALQRGLIGRILGRFEQKGLKIVGLKMLTLSQEKLADHYSHLTHLPFYGKLEAFMSSGPIVALCLEGIDSVALVRKMVGPTNSREAGFGTVRGDFGVSLQANLVHASDSSESAITEIERFFDASELYTYVPALQSVYYSSDELM